ncbi:hypothetical protein [Marinifilum caeruleilacunae]|uniref:Uncharacterized protein n=1 Tax=Marinifilum caeruleilacunae TaxID=2499076 RepID=A0ABX1WQK8_9BACT|nr:hypothetical protein [Marinifilum caeruleilacunae]NOU58377.1 hypothetical protein [Marinifilum caeruleilacunae]
MKKLLFLSLAMIMFVGSAMANGNHLSEKSTKTTSIAEILENAEKLVGAEVEFSGTVSHVCAHSGRRAFLLDETGKFSIRVEAKGEIKGFNRELSGMDIRVKGTVQEKRLSEEFINEYEQKVKAKQDAEEGGKHCSAEMTNITKMRDWMKENNKNFYSIYFVNGTSYEIVE